MLDMLTRNWWLYALRGLAAIIFGAVALIWPQEMQLVIVYTFAAFALVDGIVALFAGIALNPFFDRWWVVLLEGFAGIVFACLAFFWPGITASALLYVIAAWAIVTGIFEILTAIEFRRVLTGVWVMVIAGLLSIVFGVLLFVFPNAGMVSLVWLIGIYAIVFGVSLLVDAFRLRSLRGKVKTLMEAGI